MKNTPFFLHPFERHALSDKGEGASYHLRAPESDMEKREGAKHAAKSGKKRPSDVEQQDLLDQEENRKYGELPDLPLLQLS